MSCFCWTLRSDVRYLRDCLICKCSQIYNYKFAGARQGALAPMVISGNKRAEHMFFCDVCLAPEPEKCTMICKKRQNRGRCWPTFHAGILKRIVALLRHYTLRHFLQAVLFVVAL